MGRNDLDSSDVRCYLGEFRQPIVEVIAEPIRDLDVTAGDDNVHVILLDTM